MEPPNKGHFGDNINSAVLSFVERLSSSRWFKNYMETNFWDLALCPLYREVYYIVSLYLRGSTIRGSTVLNTIILSYDILHTKLN